MERRVRFGGVGGLDFYMVVGGEGNDIGEKMGGDDVRWVVVMFDGWGGDGEAGHCPRLLLPLIFF